MTKAEYVQTGLDELNGNPLIEAMFSSLNYSPEKLVQKLFRPISWDENAKDKLTLKLQIKKIRELFLPLPTHINLYSKLAVMILNSYKKRNPLCADVIYERYQKAMGNEYGAQDYSTLLILGHSGTGKSRSVELVINIIGTAPIVHNKYLDNQFTAIQIPAIKVSIGADGSVKSLLFEMLKEFDSKLDTKYFEKAISSRISTASLINQVASLTWMHFVGVIVIDEVQYAYKHIQSLLGFITTFVNKVNVPIVFIGTPDFLDTVSDFAVARRISTEGIIRFNNFKNEEEYEYLINQLYKYQFSNAHMVVNEDTIQTFYSKTYGNMDLTIKLYSKILENQVESETSNSNIFNLDEAYSEEFELLSRLISSDFDEYRETVKENKMLFKRDSGTTKGSEEVAIKIVTNDFDYGKYVKMGLIDDLEWSIK